MFVMNNYKVKNVSVKKDSNWKTFAYSIIVCPKNNEDYVTSFVYTVDDASKFMWISNEQQAMALVWQPCQILKSLKIN